MELDHIRESQVLADCLSLNKAAKKLSLSQSALSKHMMALEKQTRTHLFTRTSNNISITDEGKFFLQESSSAVAQIDAAIQQCRAIQAQNKRRLRIMEMTSESLSFLQLFKISSLYQQSHNASFCSMTQSL